MTDVLYCQSMVAHFADRLIEEIKKKKTPICVGLDPRLEQIPEFIKNAAEDQKDPDLTLNPRAGYSDMAGGAVRTERSLEVAARAIVAFNKGIIDAVHDIVPAVKPQFAFYIRYGSAGVRAFEETCRYAKRKGLIVIADAKSNDIGSTALAYSEAFLGDVFDCDALTVNAYLGFDGVKPFIEICKKKGKGIFVLVKTSNPSSVDLQDRVTEDGLRNYELMAHFLESWGADNVGASGYTSIGAVVGATFPDQAKQLRSLMPNAYFLVPGYGAQGAIARDVRHCFNKDGLGAIINSGREIIFAWQKSGDERNFGPAARDAVLKMKKELRSAIDESNKIS